MFVNRREPAFYEKIEAWPIGPVVLDVYNHYYPRYDPLDNYFGVPASVMMTGGDPKRVRRRYADDEAAARREASRKKREAKRLVDPEKVIIRDQRILKTVIARWKDKESTAANQITKMQAVLEKTKGALEFIKTLTEEKLSELREPLAWRKYTELSYVFLMNELF